jgi:nucleotide-binding universal stress UspA family protein
MYRKLLIAVDPEDDGEGKVALETACQLVEESGELHLASIYQPGSAGFFPHVESETPEEKEAEVRKWLDLLMRKYLPMNRSASLHVVAGTPGEALVALAASTGVDLLLLVSRGSSSHWPLRKATVEYVSVNAPCAVLILPPIPREEHEEQAEAKQS